VLVKVFGPGGDQVGLHEPGGLGAVAEQFPAQCPGPAAGSGRPAAWLR
jgi:hypothetical protein